MSADAEQLVILCYFPVMELVFLTELELQMSSSALRHGNGNSVCYQPELSLLSALGLNNYSCAAIFLEI
eukprot:6889255-Pyramimonas_sp.AAC.1